MSFINHVIFVRCLPPPSSRKRANPGNEVSLLLIVVRARSLWSVNECRCSASGV